MHEDTLSSLISEMRNLVEGSFGALRVGLQRGVRSDRAFGKSADKAGAIPEELKGLAIKFDSTNANEIKIALKKLQAEGYVFKSLLTALLGTAMKPNKRLSDEQFSALRDFAYSFLMNTRIDERLYRYISDGLDEFGQEFAELFSGQAAAGTGTEAGVAPRP